MCYNSFTETAGDAQPHPSHDLPPGRSVDQPEGDPGAGHDDDEREVGPRVRYITTYTHLTCDTNMYYSMSGILGRINDI